jgi:hypothetical protein
MSWRISQRIRRRRDGLDQRDQLGDVVAVAAGEGGGERNAVGLDDHMVLAAGPAPVHRGRAGLRPAVPVLGRDVGAALADCS